MTAETAGGEVLPYLSYRYVPPSPIGKGFCTVLVWKREYTLPILLWSREWFLRELQGCMNIFIVSIPNE